MNSAGNTLMQDLSRLSPAELEALAAELRRQILHVVSRNGGHLAGNLGTVELTLALLRVFPDAATRVVWDVGHQALAFRLLTGDAERLEKTRLPDGPAGFPVRNAGPRECFGAGHAGIAISAALGMCAAQPPECRDKVIAIVGDGALGSGSALEGLNHARDCGRNLIILLNDNKMSISPNVGALAKALNRLIVGERYARVKHRVKRFLGIFSRTDALNRRVHKVSSMVKGMLVPGIFFQELGIRYLGPVNGHDVAAVERALRGACNADGPVVIHAVTRKGRGYARAAAEPERYHGVPPFDLERGLPDEPVKGYSAAFGRALTHLAGTDPAITAVVAAMTTGTGLESFAKKFPERFFDAGIAESHAVTFAAGMAAAGKKPAVAIYATFFQRALDQIFHEIALMDLPVVLAMDRAGALEDGPTHHGIHDLGFLRALPNFTILSPRSEADLELLTAFAFTLGHPAVLRYPRGGESPLSAAIPPAPVRAGKSETIREGGDLAIWACGAAVGWALETAEVLAQRGICAKVVNVRFIRPLDAASLRRDAEQMPVATLEDHVLAGGLGDAAAAALADHPHTRLARFGWPDNTLLPHGKLDSLRARSGLDAAALAQKMQHFINAGQSAEGEPK